MKIKINYELLETIKDSKTGLSLKRDIKMIMSHSAISSTISCFILNKATIEDIIFITLQNIAFHTIYRYFVGKMLSPAYKEIAQRRITGLINALHNLQISTDESLILEAYQYKTDYQIYLNKNFI